MNSPDDPLAQGPEINDLETAKLALHGLLARNRSMQDMNERLKGELQEVLHREKLALERVIEAKADTRLEREKDKEILQLREELKKKSDLVRELQQEAQTVQIRNREQWATALERAREDQRNAVAEAVVDKDALIKGLRLYTAQQISEMEDHCRQFEAEVTKKEQAMTREFLLRNEQLADQWKAREQDLWEQEKKIQANLKADMDLQLQKRLAALDQDRHQDKAALGRKMKDLEAQFIQRKTILQSEFEAREKDVRATYERAEADMQKRIAQRAPTLNQQRLHEKELLEKQLRQFEEQWLTREAYVRSEYATLEHDLRAAYEKSETDIRTKHQETVLRLEVEWTQRLERVRQDAADALQREATAHHQRNETLRASLLAEAEQAQQELHAHQLEMDESARNRARQSQAEWMMNLQAERERALNKQRDLFQHQIQTLTAKHQDECARYETTIVHLQALVQQNEVRLKALDAQLIGIQADSERLQGDHERLKLEFKRATVSAEFAIQHVRADLERAQIVLQEKHAETEAAQKAEQAVLEKKLQTQIQKAADLDGARLRLENIHAKVVSERAAQVKALEQSLTSEMEKSADLTRQRLQLEESHAQQVAQALDQIQALEQTLNQQLQKAGDVEAGRQHLEMQKTTLRTAEQSLRAHVHRLGAIQRTMEEGIFGFAHQIRNPLAIIRSMTESFGHARANQVLDPKAAERILQSVDGLSERLEQFIAFSKPLEPASDAVPLGEVYQQAMTSLHERCVAQGIHVQPHLALHLPTVPGSAAHFEIVFFEVLKNAIDAMPRGGTLHVRLKADDAQDAVVVDIHDSGIGIHPQRIQDVGKPFFTTKPGRTGLGLARVRRILHLYAGRFSIETPAGGGTTVHLVFACHGWSLTTGAT